MESNGTEVNKSAAGSLYPRLSAVTLDVNRTRHAKPAKALFPTFWRSSDIVPVPNFVAPMHAKGDESAQGRPIPTNKFWTELVLDDGSHTVYLMPYIVRVNKYGYTRQLSVSYDYKTEKYDKDKHKYQTLMRPSLIIGDDKYQLDKQKIRSWDTFGAHLTLYSDNSQASITFPLFQGLSYITAEYNDVNPRIQFSRIGIYIAGRRSGDSCWRYLYSRNVMLPLLPESKSETSTLEAVVKLDKNNQMWKIWLFEEPSSEEPLEWRWDDWCLVCSRCFKGTLRAALVSDYCNDSQTRSHLEYKQNVVIFDRHAGAWPIGGKLSLIKEIDYSRKRGYQIEWKLHKEQETDELLHYAFPHHVECFHKSSPTETTAIFLEAPTKGVMQAVRGNFWRLQLPEIPHDVLSLIPESSNLTSGHISFISEVVRGEIDEIDAENDILMGRWGYTGKKMQKLAYLCLVARAVLGPSDPATKQGIEKLKTAFKYVMQKRHSSKAPPPLHYDLSWGGIVTSGGLSNIIDTVATTDHGNAGYNAHHYQFGSFIVAAAALVDLDPSWADDSDNTDFVEALIRDVATFDDEDEEYPTFRCFSWFDGHSWSRGILLTSDGK